MKIDIDKKPNCRVLSCKYEKEGKCICPNLLIDCRGSIDDCHDASSTLCQSFESSGGIITDNEYEVKSEILEI